MEKNLVNCIRKTAEQGLFRHAHKWYRPVVWTCTLIVKHVCLVVHLQPRAFMCSTKCVWHTQERTSAQT